MKLTDKMGRRIRKRVEEIDALERAVVEAAVERRKAEQMSDDARRDGSVSVVVLAELSRRFVAALAAENAAVDAYLAALEGR